jgi:hypothetical protein
VNGVGAWSLVHIFIIRAEMCKIDMINTLDSKYDISEGNTVNGGSDSVMP